MSQRGFSTILCPMGMFIIRAAAGCCATTGDTDHTVSRAPAKKRGNKEYHTDRTPPALKIDTQADNDQACYYSYCSVYTANIIIHNTSSFTYFPYMLKEEYQIECILSVTKSHNNELTDASRRGQIYNLPFTKIL